MASLGCLVGRRRNSSAVKVSGMNEGAILLHLSQVVLVRSQADLSVGTHGQQRNTIDAELIGF
jgi:hypothetical protein